MKLLLSINILFIICLMEANDTCADLHIDVNTASTIKLSSDTVRISLEWGWAWGIWDGSLAIENGLLESYEAPLMEEGETVRRISANSIRWNSETAGPTDGFIISISQCNKCFLVFNSKSLKFRVSLIDIIRARKEYKSGVRGAKLIVKRLPEDILRIKSPRANYIFEPGEEWFINMSLEPGIISTKEIPATIKLKLQSEDNHVSHGFWVAVINVTKKKDIVVKVTLPVKEGVYSAVITVDGLPVQIPQKIIQFIVIDSSHLQKTRSISHQTTQNRELADVVFTAETHGADRFRSDGTDSVVGVGSAAYRVTGKRAEQTFSNNDKSRTMNWFAYKLSTKGVGKPHILKIVYPGSVKQRFVVSIIDRNASQIASSVLDYMIASDGNSSKPWVTSEIVIWPKQSDIGVVIVNTLPGVGAAINSISLFEVHGKLENGYNPLHKFCKKTGVYFEEAEFSRSLGGKRVLDKGMHTNDKSRTDWRTWYQTINNLIEMMDYYGHQEALIPVYGYGSALYPSKYLGQGTKYDDGLQFVDGRDPVKKDILRLLLIMFERANKKIIPVYEFYGKVDEFERIRSSHDTDGNYIDLVNDRGVISRDKLKLRSVGPFYNPVHPMVQEWVKNVMAELVNNYGDSPALGDPAIQLNTISWIHYPGLSWGYDMGTFNRFLDDVQLSSKLDFPQKGTLIQQWLLDNDLHGAWLDWRNSKITNLFKDITTGLRSNNKNRKLILLYLNIFNSMYGDRELDLNRKSSTSLKTLLRRRGVDPEVLSTIPGVSIVRPIRLAAPWVRTSEQRSTVHIGQPAEMLFSDYNVESFVSHHDYYETYVNSINTGLWWKIRYWMVASYYSEKQFLPLMKYSWKSCFDGGWQVPQYQKAQ